MNHGSKGIGNKILVLVIMALPFSMNLPDPLSLIGLPFFLFTILVSDAVRGVFPLVLYNSFPSIYGYSLSYILWIGIILSAWLFVRHLRRLNVRKRRKNL